MINPNTSSINSELITEQVDDNLLLLKPSDGKYIVLSQTGSLIWQLLTDGVDINSIPSHIANIYKVSTAEAQTDLDTLIAELTQRGFLHA